MNQYSETELRNHGTVEMYDESGYFDPSMVDNPTQLPTYNNINLSHNEGMEDNNIRVSTYSLDDLSNSNHHLSDEAAAAAMGLDHLHQHLGLDLEHELHSHLIQHQEPPMESANWDPTIQEQQNVQCYSAAPDLLNLLQLPRCTVAPPVFPPTGSISFGGPSLNVGDGGSVLYDSSLHLGYPPPQLRDLFSSLPQNYGLFCGVEERGDAGVYQEMDGMQFESTVLDYRREVKGEVKGSFVTERHRREQLNEKYKTLRSLIPNPTKADRASIVGDAIECIKELGRTVEELKILVEQKRRRERRSMQKTEDEAGAGDMESSSMRPLRDDPDRPLNGALRSSWLQRKSKDSFVDVRIVDDEVNIKLTQKRKASCLISVAKALDELQLDLVHVTGGNVVDHHIFMLNAKICEGSSVYAGAIAKKLLEVMDRQHQTLTFADSF